MNRDLKIGFSCAAAALIGLGAASLAAQQPAPTGGRRGANPPATQGGGTTSRGAQPAKPAAPPTEPAAPGRGGRSGTNVGSDTPGPAPAPTPVTMLGTVHISKAVKADGQPLAAGTYQMRMTEREAAPAAAGQTPQYERWAEFLQRGQVKGREVVTIVTPDAARQVLKEKFPPSGGYRADVLKGGDYYRIWFNKGGTHYLVHFNI